MKRERMNNKGYSLLEVVIVVSLIALFTGVAFIGFRVLNSRQVDDCVKKLKMGLESNKVTTMGKFESSVSIYVDSKGYLTLDESINGEINTKRIGDDNLKYEYKVDAGAWNNVPGASNKLTVKFNRNSGSVETTEVTDFRISLGNTSVTVNIDKLTGRVSVN